MGLFDWLNRVGGNATVKLDGEEYIELDVVAPYEEPMISQVMADREIPIRSMPTYDVVIGTEKIRLLVKRHDLERASNTLSWLRSQSG